MKLFKFSSISFLVFLSLILSTPVLAIDAPKDATSSKAVVLATVNIQEAKIVSQEGNTFDISFSLSNREGLQTGVKYGVRLMKESSMGQIVVDEEIYEESLTLNPNSTIQKEIKYIAPSNLDGQYLLSLVSNNTNGFPFGSIIIGKISLTASSLGLRIFPETCILQRSLESAARKFTLGEGISISSTEDIILTCTAVNFSKSDMTFTPSYETRIRSSFGDKVETTGGDKSPIVYKTNENKNFSVKLSKITTPEKYNMNFVLESNGSKTNTISFDYIVKGTVTSIINLSLDKDYYKKGESAQASFFYMTNLPSVIISKVEIVNGNGKVCAEPITKTLEKKLSEKVDLLIPVIQNCTDPTITLTLSDENGTVLDQKEFKVETTSEKSNNNLIYIVIITILILLSLGYIYMKKRKTPTGTSLYNDNVSGQPVEQNQTVESTNSIPMNVILPFLFMITLFGFTPTHVVRADTVNYYGGVLTMNIGPHEGTVGFPYTTSKGMISASVAANCMYWCPFLHNVTFGASNGVDTTAVKIKPSKLGSLFGSIAEAVTNNNLTGYKTLFSVGSAGTNIASGGAGFYVQNTAGTYSMNFADSNGFSHSISYIVKDAVVIPPDPTVTIFADKDKIKFGEGVNISWISQDADSCSCSYNGGGSKDVNCGHSTGNGSIKNASLNPYVLEVSTTFTVTCIKEGTSASTASTTSSTVPTTTTTGGGGGGGYCYTDEFGNPVNCEDNTQSGAGVGGNNTEQAY